MTTEHGTRHFGGKKGSAPGKRRAEQSTLKGCIRKPCLADDMGAHRVWLVVLILSLATGAAVGAGAGPTFARAAAGTAGAAGAPAGAEGAQSGTAASGEASQVGRSRSEVRSKPGLYTRPRRSIAVVEHRSDLMLVEDGQTRRLVLPGGLLQRGRFAIRIPAPAAPEDEGVAEEPPTLKEAVAARRLVHAANAAFFRGEKEKAWDLIDQAEALNPQDYRIYSMKGSLLFSLGSKDLAMALWQESLAMEPDQPEIRRLLGRLAAGQDPSPGEARAAATQPGRRGQVRR